MDEVHAPNLVRTLRLKGHARARASFKGPYLSGDGFLQGWAEEIPMIWQDRLAANPSCIISLAPSARWGAEGSFFAAPSSPRESQGRAQPEAA